MADETKTPQTLTHADFARLNPGANLKLAEAALETERIEKMAREKQVLLLVSIRKVARILGIPFAELLEESRLRFQEALD